MRLKIVIIILCLIIITLIFLSFFKNDDKMYVKNYFRVIGIKKTCIYGDVIDSMGTPIRAETSINKFNEESMWLSVYYEDCELGFEKHINQPEDKYFLNYVKITGPKYRFGKYKIGIGSSYKEVKKAYRGFDTLKKPKSGYIDRFTYVEFKFDSDKRVNGMMFYIGP